MIIYRSFSYIITYIFIMLFFFLFIKQRYKKTKFLLISFIVILALMAGDIFRVYMFPNNNIVNILVTLINIILIQSIAFITSETRDSKALFTSFCGSNYVSIGTIIGTIIFIYTEKIIVALVIDTAIQIIIIAVMYFTIQKEYMSFYDDRDMKSWWELCLVPSFFFITIIFITTFPTPLFLNPNNIIGIVVLLFTMIVSYTVIFHYIQGEISRREIYRKNEIFEYYIKGLESQYEMIEKLEQNLKILRHDMRHYVELINSLLDKKEYEEVKDIVRHINVTVKENKVEKYCENLKVNTIVTKMAEKAKSFNILVDINMYIPRQLPFSDIELASVIANTMENSINAVKNMEEKQRIITILARYVDKRLIIEIKNRCEKEIIFNSVSKLPVNIKGDGHGIGLQSVSFFADKIGANLDCYCENKTFTIRLLANF